MIFSNMNSNCSNILDMRNLQEQVKKTFCYQKLFWPFTVWINCSSDLENFENSRPSALNFKSHSRSLEHFFLTVGQNNFGNKTQSFQFFFTEVTTTTMETTWTWSCSLQWMVVDHYIRRGKNHCPAIENGLIA